MPVEEETWRILINAINLMGCHGPQYQTQTNVIVSRIFSIYRLTRDGGSQVEHRQEIQLVTLVVQVSGQAKSLMAMNGLQALHIRKAHLLIQYTEHKSLTLRA